MNFNLKKIVTKNEDYSYKAFSLCLESEKIGEIYFFLDSEILLGITIYENKKEYFQGLLNNKSNNYKLENLYKTIIKQISDIEGICFTKPNYEFGYGDNSNMEVEESGTLTFSYEISNFKIDKKEVKYGRLILGI